MKLLHILCLAAILSTIGTAAPIFSDNFDTENSGAGQLNYTTLTNWTVTQASVDLIGNGLYDFYPGQGLFLDLDGTTGNAGNGQIVSNPTFGPGTYQLTFFLGNNPGGGSTINQLKVELGDWNATYNTSNSIPAATINVTFTSTVGGALTFSQFGPGDQQGSILDNVELSTLGRSAEAPEPSTLMMLAAAGAALIGLSRFRK